MKKNKVISLLASTALVASFASAANAQTTITGNVGASYLVGDTSVPAGAAGFIAPKTLATSSAFTIAHKAKLANGMDVNIAQEITSADGDTFGVRTIAVTAAKGIDVGYSFDGTQGSEIARTPTPFVTDRNQGVHNLGGVVSVLDVTSGEHFLYTNITGILPMNARLSLAYMPNSSVVRYTTTNMNKFSGTEGNASKGYGVGLTLSPVAGLTVSAGQTTIDQRNETHQDGNGRTIGLRYSTGPISVGAQKFRNKGLAAPTTAATQTDEVTTFSATYAVDKALSVGIYQATQERNVGGTKSTVDTRQRGIQVGYNLGPAVLSYDFDKATDTPASSTTPAVRGRDIDVHKVKFNVAF